MRKVSRLLKAAKCAGVGVQARSIWDEHPYLKEITEAVVDHFSGFDSGETKLPVAENAVLEAVSAYTISSKNSDDDAMVNYLAGLFSSLHTASDKSAVVESSHWLPDSTVSFTKFKESGNVSYIKVMKNEPAKLRSLLMLKFIGDEDSISVVAACRTGKKWVKKNG